VVRKELGAREWRVVRGLLGRFVWVGEEDEVVSRGLWDESEEGMGDEAPRAE